VGDPACRWLLDRFAAAGIDVAVFDVTSDLGIPAFLALIDDATGTTGAPELGCGAHPAPEVALARALTEAAQARATFIAGAREDIPDEDYGEAALATRRGCRAGDPRRPSAHALVRRPARRRRASFEDDIEATLAALARAGMRQAIAVDVGKPAFGLAVVRVVVPGLEAALEGPRSDYVPGRRAAALLAEAAA
jgi:YcaO-like protein with predicted kinase domain